MLEVVFHLAAPLTETEQSFTFIQAIDGEIRDDESKVIIGQISASLVQVGRIANAGEDLFEVMDGQSREMAEYHATFFEPNDWEYKEGIRRQFPNILSLDFLILERAEIEPRFRKRGLGLLAVSRTIDLFGANCGLVAMMPFPLQFRNYLNPGWCPPDGLQDPAAAFRIARRKLRQYWSRVGFKRVIGTDYCALCPVNDRPSLKKVAAAIDETFAAQD